jgi:hypothetical protein
MADGVRATAPLLRTDSDLRLEGLEIRWSIEGPRGIAEEEMLGRSTVVVTHGRLAVAYCRLISDRFNGCLAATCRDVDVRNTQLITNNGVGIFWRPEAGGGLDLENCILENRFGITVLIDGVAKGSSPGQLQLRNSTIAAVRAIQLVIESPPKQQLQFNAEQMIFDTEALFMVLAQRQIRALSKSGDVTQAIQVCIDWKEKNNVYRRGMQYIVRPSPARQGATVPVDIAGVDRWLQLWRQPLAGSIEGTIRMKPRTESAKTSPLVVDTFENATGSVPENLGPNTGQVGPGAPYDFWRHGTDYSHWPG